MSKNINKIQDQIIEEFNFFDDPMDKYDYIIDLGRQLPPMDEKYKTDDNLIRGCQSKVWLHAEEKDGRIFFQADSNTLITKGIIALLIRVLSDQPIDDILNNELYFIDKIDLWSHLSSQRSNGLLAMIKKMKMYVLAYKTKTLNEK